jgi:nitroimidazol reductase NimA-like FMN-containing flavoprotein (pyridoxamine 5'-phosphate oxidase superfamily)
MPSLTELEPEVCLRLLRRGTFGRFAVVTPRGPDVVPVNYTVRDGVVVTRTSPDGTLARYGDGVPLAFQVDLVDHERWHGWSVVARGTGVVVTAPVEGGQGVATARSWADGDRSCELQLAWTELSGRQVGIGWDPEAAMYNRQVLG